MKRRLIENPSLEVEDSRADNFINDIIAIYKKHGFSLTHEDCEGGFIVDKFSDNNVTWLQNALISTNIL